MKYAITLFLAIIFSAISFPCLHAQNIDNERMNRDINITENILQEMFKTSSARGGIHLSSGSFSFGSKSDISGTYLQNYGVIFTIPGQTSTFIFKSNDDGEASTYSFQYGDGEGEGKEVSQKTITNRIKEFLREYGSTIGQLSNDDRITIIYGRERSRSVAIVRAFSGGGEQVEKESTLPSSIYVTAKKSDLEAYKKGSISDAQFDSRLNISVDEEDASRQDLKIMSNILKTSFEDSENDAFRVRGSVNNIYIDDLGALFYLDSSYGSGIFALNAAVVKVREEIKKIDRNDTTSVWLSKSPRDDKEREELKKERAEAYKKFLQQLKETIVDYGRTLKSVQSDEQVFVSVSLSQSGDSIPERVDLQIKKSVLHQLDHGRTSREQAINQIKVREY